MRFDRSFLAIAAAADGLGVALESTRLAERELATGPPRRPADREREKHPLCGTPSCCPHTGLRRRPVRIFATWLCTELGLPAPDR